MLKRNAADWMVMAIAVVLEPACHLMGLPHPEGLPQLAVNYLSTR